MRLVALMLLLPLAGCIELFQPPFVPSPPPPPTGNAIADCRAAADTNQPVTQGMQGVAVGAGVGAALGAVISGFASLTPVGTAIGWGALAGGLTGGAVMAAKGYNEREAAIAACGPDQPTPIVLTSPGAS